MVYVLQECQFARDQMGKFRTLNGHVNDSANESDFELVNPDPVTDHQKRNSSESQLQQINNLLSDLGQQLQDPQKRS